MEDELQQLVLEVKQHGSQSRQGKRILTQLLTRIQQAPNLKRPQRGSWPSQLYEDLHSQALSQTMLELSRLVDQYDRSVPVIGWVNQRLEWRFIDAVKEYCYGGGMTKIPRQQAQETAVTIRSLEQWDLEKWDLAHLTESATAETEVWQNFIETDPEQQFIAHIRNRPEATMQFLLLERLNQQTWDDISAKLGPPLISKSTLSSFFERQLHTLADYFRKYILE